jgi:hypothetical protein
MKDFGRGKGRASEANCLVDMRVPNSKVPDALGDENDLLAKPNSIGLSGSPGCRQSCAKMGKIFLFGKGSLEIDPKLLSKYVIDKGAPLDQAC